MSQERDASEERSNSRSPRQSDYFVKLHGLSSSVNKGDIKEFLSPCQVTVVHLFDNSTTSSTDCFVGLESEDDLKDALKKSGQLLNKREIEVRRTTSHECNFHVKHKGTVTWREPVIRMNGLPFECIMADVQNFFEDIEIARNGIYITRDMADQALGNGFVAFVNMDNAYKAIDMHDQKRIQHRYIELFPSTYEEAKRRILDDARSNARQFVGEDDNNDESRKDETENNHTGRQHSRSRSRQRSRSTSRDRRPREVKRRHSPSVSPSPRSRPPPRSFKQRSSNDNHRRRSRSRSPVRRASSRSEEHVVKIRGMPFTVVEEDIRKFFPSSCQPRRIEIVQDRRMKRPNGDGHLYFNSIKEVDEAMKYDRKYMGSRYIELYFDSPRYASLTNRRKKPDGNPRRSSRSTSRSRPKYNRRSRSRSDSMH